MLPQDGPPSCPSNQLFHPVGSSSPSGARRDPCLLPKSPSFYVMFLHFRGVYLVRVSVSRVKLSPDRSFWGSLWTDMCAGCSCAATREPGRGRACGLDRPQGRWLGLCGSGPAAGDAGVTGRWCGSWAGLAEGAGFQAALALGPEL